MSDIAAPANLDTAAFFAKKKTKKKKFKSFNANKIDASAITTSAHVDAPDILNKDASTALGGLSLGGATTGADGLSSGDDQWADTQGGGWGSNNISKPATSSGDSKVAELLDMRALTAKRNEQDDVAERLRIEDTKAKLARAKEGMAKEAERLAFEKESKVAARAGGMGGRMAGGSASALGGGGTGGKWVPSHMRSAGGAAGGGSRFGLGSATRGAASMDGTGLQFQKPVDMANEELFPDLADADKILAEKEKQTKDEQDRNAGTKAPKGWGSRMGAGSAAAAPAQRPKLNLAPAPAERKPLNLASSQKKEEEPEAKKEEKTEEVSKPAAAAELTPAETPTPAPAATATPAPEKPAESKEPAKKKVLKKKKKKDLSTFKAK